jgi:N utilization substance protein A
MNAMKTYDCQASANYDGSELREKGLGPNSAGQSGDTQGLSDDEAGDSEGVVELLEEGQAFEAEAVGGLEEAADADADVAEVHTRQFPEDDVPLEYLQGEHGDQ